MDISRAEFDRLAANIALWNAKVFPDATEESQTLKLHEEMMEYEKEHTLDEWADCIIAAAGLKYRFHTFLGQIAWDYLMTESFFKGVNLAFNAVQEKMAENVKRKWVKDELRIYRHVEE